MRVPLGSDLLRPIAIISNIKLATLITAGAGYYLRTFAGYFLGRDIRSSVSGKRNVDFSWYTQTPARSGGRASTTPQLIQPT